ncbi:CYB2, partial [Symbiodinium sp. KB8]
DGEVAIVKAAKKAGVPYMLPTLSSYTLDEMLAARTPDQQVFSQLYVNPERSRSEEYVKKLEDAGVKALFVTVDAPQLGRREKDMRNKFTQQGSDVQGDDEDEGAVDRSQGATRAISSYIDPGLNWEDVPWLKSITKMKVLLKGVQCAEDAVSAYKAGLSGCVLSNHGGRQLDTCRPGIEVLPEVMEGLREAGATKENFAVFIDGGVRRGGDIFKAVALGAQAVGVGRPVLYSLASYGMNGIVRMVHMLQDELQMVMRLSGTPNIPSITEKHVIITNLADHIVPLPTDFLVQQPSSLVLAELQVVSEGPSTRLVVPSTRSLDLLRWHHSVAPGFRYRLRQMGKQHGWHKDKWSKQGGNSSPSWSMWRGARQQRSGWEDKTPPAPRHSFPSYDSTKPGQEDKKIMVLRETRSSQPSSGSQGLSLVQCVQQAVNTARKSSNRVAKLRRDIELRDAQWQQYTKDIKASFAKEKERHTAAVQSLEQELLAAQEAAQLDQHAIQKAADSCFLAGGDTGSGDNEAWNALMAEDDKMEGPTPMPREVWEYMARAAMQLRGQVVHPDGAPLRGSPAPPGLASQVPPPSHVQLQEARVPDRHPAYSFLPDRPPGPITAGLLFENYYLPARINAWGAGGSNSNHSNGVDTMLAMGIPTYNSIVVKQHQQQRGEAYAPGDGHSDDLNHLQAAINTARKAEQKVIRIQKQQILAQEQWEIFAQSLKDGWIRERKRFMRDGERLSADLAAAMEGQQKEVVQEIEDAGWESMVGGSPDFGTREPPGLIASNDPYTFVGTPAGHAATSQDVAIASRPDIKAATMQQPAVNTGSCSLGAKLDAKRSQSQGHFQLPLYLQLLADPLMDFFLGHLLTSLGLGCKYGGFVIPMGKADCPEPSGVHEGYAAVICDLTRIGGSYFATVLPNNLSHEALVSFLAPLVPASDDPMRFFVGCRTKAWPVEALVTLRDGDAISAVRNLDSTVPRHRAESLHDRGMWGPMHQFFEPAYQQATCVLHRDQRFCVDISPSQGIDLFDQVVSLLSLDAASTAVCTFPIEDLEVQGTRCQRIVTVADVAAPTGGYREPVRQDFFVLCDLRPLGLKPRFVYAHLPRLHLPSLIADLGIALPAAFQVGVAGARVSDDVVRISCNCTLLFYAKEAEPDDLDDLVSIADLSPAPESPDSFSEENRRSEQTPIDAAVLLASQHMDTTIPEGHGWNLGVEGTHHHVDNGLSSAAHQAHVPPCTENSAAQGMPVPWTYAEYCEHMAGAWDATSSEQGASAPTLSQYKGRMLRLPTRVSLRLTKRPVQPSLRLSAIAAVANDRYGQLAQRFTLGYRQEPCFHAALCEHLGSDEHRLSAIRVHPEITDAFPKGHWTTSVVVATEQISSVPYPPARAPNTGVALVLDCRPLLLGIRWLLLHSAFIPVSEVVQPFQELCPHEYMVTVSGCSAVQRDNDMVFPIQSQVLVISFTEDLQSSDQTDGPPNVPPDDPHDTQGPDGDYDTIAPDSPGNEGLPEEEDSTDRAEASDEITLVDVTFLVLAPEYCPESVTMQIAVPQTVGEAIELLDLCRPSTGREMFPQLYPVHPQPDVRWGLAVAAPSWPTARVIVCLDLTLLDGRIFAAAAPPELDKHILLNMAGLSGAALVDVYLAELAAPVEYGAELLVANGDCISFVPANAPLELRCPLQTMLRSHLGWAEGPAFPQAASDDRFCAVSAGFYCDFLLLPERAAFYRADLASRFQVPINLLCLQPAAPRQEDVTVYGRHCRTVICVGSSHRRDDDQVGLLDCRPVLEGWTKVLTVDRWLDVGSLRQHFQLSAPAGHLVDFSGCCRHWNWLWLEPGQVVVVSYTLDDNQPFDARANHNAIPPETGEGPPDDGFGPGPSEHPHNDGSGQHHQSSAAARFPTRDSPDDVETSSIVSCQAYSGPAIDAYDLTMWLKWFLDHACFPGTIWITSALVTVLFGAAYIALHFRPREADLFLHRVDALASRQCRLPTHRPFYLPMVEPPFDQENPLHIAGLNLGFSLNEARVFLNADSSLVDVPTMIDWCLSSDMWQPSMLNAAIIGLRVSCKPGELFCYTDGSYTPGSSDKDPLCGWACVFIDPHAHRLSAAYGSCPYAVCPLDSPSAYLGECAGLLAAALISTVALQGHVVHFLSDCTSALAAASGTASYALGGLAQTCNSAFCLRRATGHLGDTHCYVPGHSNCFGNDLADALSKYGAKGLKPGCGITISDELAQFWLGMEGGYEVSVTDLIAKWDARIQHGVDDCPWPLPPQLADVPTEADLRRLLAGAKAGKSPGMDGIPVEVGKRLASSLAPHLHRLALKTAFRGVEPCGFKAGQTIWFYKGKGPHTSCSSFRAILLLPVWSKIVHQALRPPMKCHFESNAPAFQIGGRSRCTAVFGCHLVRSACRVAVAAGHSHFTLFADIASAYYCVIQQLVAKWVGRGKRSSLTDGMHMSPGETFSDEVAAHLCQPSAMCAGGASTWLEALTDCFQSDNFFLLRGDDTAVMTSKGSRPGSSWADLIFAALVRRILERRNQLRSERDELSSPLTLPYDGRKCLDPSPGDAAKVSVSEVVWADDLAIPRLTDPYRAAKALGFEASILTDAFKEFGFSLTFGLRGLIPVLLDAQPSYPGPAMLPESMDIVPTPIFVLKALPAWHAANGSLPRAAFEGVCTDVAGGLLQDLISCNSAEEDEVWDIVISYVEPLAVLRATVMAWASHDVTDQVRRATADNILLLLDVELLADCVQPKCTTRAFPQDTLPVWADPGQAPFVMTGEVATFQLLPPPPVYLDFAGPVSMRLRDAVAYSTWLADGCDTIARLIDVSRTRPVTMACPGRYWTGYDAIPRFLQLSMPLQVPARILIACRTRIELLDRNSVVPYGSPSFSLASLWTFFVVLGQAPDWSDPHDLDLQLRISIADNACSHILNASLDNSEDLPVPPLNDDESVEDAGSFVTGIFYVLAPHYQSEIVQMVLRMPSDLQSILTQARRGLNSLRMRFSFKVVPTFPQLGPDYASVLVVPVWLEATSMQVVVWDFRGLGGPVYAAYCWNGMTYGDCVRESRRHGFHRWLVYVNGHSQALAPDSTFVAVPGTLPDRIERPNSWNADPDLPEIQVERPLLILHHDQTTLFSSSRHPVPSARVFLTSLVERTPETALIVAPPGNFLTDVDFYGVACRDVLGVYPLTPCPDRESILIFLDPRQTGNPLAHILLPERRVAPVELVRFLSLRPPVCHKIAFWPRPMEDGRLLLSEGDTVVFGYVDETVCSDDSTGELSDSSDDPDADSAHDSPDGHNTPSPSYRLPFFGLDPDHLEALGSPDEEEQVPAQLQMICCAVFKHGYSPECVTVPVPLPATPDELLDALRSARAPAMQELFPVLSPIIPQHGEGNAIFSARPVWGPGFVSVCLDTSAFDGRIFLGYVAPYVTRAELIRKANLPPNVEPDVWVGFDSECLPEETWAHMVSGLLIHFTPPGEKSPELSSLGLLLLQPERWSGTPVSTVPSVEGAYCLVQEDHCRLFLADTRYPALFHQQLSLASGVDQACMRLFAAQPCPSDAMVEGVLCKAVIGVAVQGPHLRARPWHLVLLDCRPIECGWQAWVVFDCQLDLDVLLTAYSADAPLGWCARLALQTQQRGMQTVPGQTLVICFVPADSSWAFGGSVVPDAHVLSVFLLGLPLSAGSLMNIVSHMGEVGFRLLGLIPQMFMSIWLMSLGHFFVMLRLRRMLSTAEGWHSEPQLPGPFERLAWVLVNQVFAFQIGASPEVFVASRPSGVEVFYILDLRPILLDLLFAAARGGRVEAQVGLSSCGTAVAMITPFLMGKEASAFVFHGSSTPWVWHAVCAISLYFDALRDGVVMWLTGPFQAALLLGSRWLTSVLSLRAVGCLIQCIAGRLQALASSSVQPSLSQQGRAGRAFAVLVCAYGLTRLAPATHALAAAGFLTAFMPAAVSDLRWSPSTLVVGILLLQLLSPAGAVKLNSPEPPVDCLSGVARALRSAILHSIPRPLVSRDSEPRSGHVEPECQFVHKCLDFPASIGIVLGIEGFRTLLEESAWHSSSQAFYLASTLLDTLEEHFRECAPPSVSSPSLNGSSAHGPGRVVVYLDREIDVGRGPTASLFGTGSSSVHSGSARLGDSVQDCYDRPGPQFFDLTRQSCQLPGDSQVIQQFFTRTRFAFLRDAPSGLDKPHRFQAWLAAGTVGRSPSPTEEVVLTSDGSFRADSLAAGWGLVVSLRSSAEDAGQFVGCLFGSLAPFLPYLGGSQFPDAYDAEVAGLIWGAVAIAQLPAFGRVVVRADNISALRGVEGAAQMRASPLCLAARSLHASVGIAGSGQVRYEHVRGHSGEPANELADALAVLGATGCSSSAPFCLPISELFSEDALVARWLPHFAMSSKRALELPCLDSGVLSWPCTPGSPVHPPDFSMRPFLRAFPAADSLARCPAAGAWLDFRIATYNALSLLDGVKERSAGLHGLPGRPTLLQQSLVTAGVHVAGLQECRTTAGTMKCGRFTRFASGCDEHSCFGNELWVSADGPCDPTSVVLLHSAPTVLIAHARVGRHQIHFFVGHAPHRGHTLETRRAWWSAAAHLCHSYPRHVPWVFLLDANCRLGSRETHSVGSHQADDEDDAGVFLHDLLLGLDLCAPSTFASCMIGEGGTLYQKRSGALDRSDYVCIPRAWLPGDCRAWVDPSIAVGHACIDHLAAVVHCCLPSLGKQVSRDRAVRLDAQALADPDNRSRVEQIILGAPRPAWDTDVSEHAAEVVDYLYEAFSRNFPLPKRRLRASFFSEETTALHQAVAALRHAVRTRTHALRSTYLRCVLLAWRSPDADFGSFFCGSWLWNLRARLGHNCMLLRRFGRRLRSACKSDKVADTWREHFRPLPIGLTPLRKASGPDLIPPSICRAFSFSLTELFWPLLLKSLCYAAEPAGMKGGVLFHIDKGKPGAKAECASHRGILAQSCLSKVLHRSLRGLVVDHWSRNSMPLQVGGKPGCSATFGHLCSRSVLNFAKTRGLSAGLLFVDLQSAYYAVIRETVLGGGLSDRPLAAVADALGLDAEDLQILKYYVEEEPILHQQNASPLLVTMARELHQQTWFVLSEDPRAVLVETQRGTRPGGTLADVLFNVLFAKVLARRRDSACSSLSPSVPWCGVRTPFPDVTLPCDHTIQVTDIAYADDLCTPVVCQAACDLRGAVSCMTADTMDVLTPHALRPNLGPAKTAAVFAPVGKGSKQARCEAFVQLKGRVPIWPESKGLLWLDLVPRYRHLGSLISHDGKMGPEIRHRLALAASAFKEGKRKLFACKAIPLPKRALLFRSHVLSVLLSGAGTWPWLAKGEWQSFRGGVLGLYRQLLCLRASGDWHHTAAQIYSQVGLPSAEALLHAERLRLLGQLVRNAPDHVWALVAWNKPFQEGLQEACVWLYSLVGSTVSFGPIAANWSVWSCFIQSRPGHWKGLIRRAETADIERQHITAAFDRSIRETWAPLAPPCLSPMAEMDHACLLCGLAFSTQQQWGAHAQRKHGYRNSASKLAKGRQCQSCGTLYASQARLKTHLLASATCRHFLETLPQASLVPSGPGEGHVQAPPVRFASSLSVRSVGPDLCHDLLEALRHVESADDQEIFDLVSSFVAPLPVLRRTLRTWADSLLRGALLSSAEDVLLVLKPDLLCSQICGKVSEGLDLQTFDPCIVQPVHRPPSSPGSVFSVGACDAAWLQRWQLSYLPVVDTGLTELTSLPATCSGLCLTLPLPPCYAGSFLCPGSLPLRLLRQVSLWTSGFFASLPHALRIAARGVPVLLRVPVRSDQLLPVSAWLTRTATEFEAGLAVGLKRILVPTCGFMYWNPRRTYQGLEPAAKL